MVRQIGLAHPDDRGPIHENADVVARGIGRQHEEEGTHGWKSNGETDQSLAISELQLDGVGAASAIIAIGK